VAYRLQIEGRAPAGVCIVAANHESMLDPPLLASVADQPLRFLAKEQLWKYRASAWLMESLGGIPVARGREGHVAIARAEALLRAGESVAIFPEGTILGGTWTRGAARLALATGVPIVPVRIVGTKEALSRGRFGFPRIRLIVGEPIEVTAVAKPTVAAARELTNLLRNRIEAL